MDFPAELKYTAEHEWIRIEDNTATVGITAFAQDQLGDIVFVEIETLDDSLDQNEVFGTVEAVKTVSDLFMPLAGTVSAVNEALEDKPELVNQDPYGDGWMIKIELAADADLSALLSAESYQASLPAA